MDARWRLRVVMMIDLVPRPPGIHSTGDRARPSISQGQRLAICLKEFRPHTPAVGFAQHRQREIDPHHSSATRSGEFCQVAGPARQVDDAVAASHANPAKSRSPPTLIEPEGEQPIQTVVARRDAIEHRANPRALLRQRRQRVECVHRWCTIHCRATPRWITND